MREAHFPIGEHIEKLDSCRKLRVDILLFFRKNSIEKKRLFLEEVKVTIFVNHSRRRHPVQREDGSGKGSKIGVSGVSTET